MGGGDGCAIRVVCTQGGGADIKHSDQNWEWLGLCGGCLACVSRDSWSWALPWLQELNNLLLKFLISCR